VESNGGKMIRRRRKKKKNSDKNLQNVTSSTMDITLSNSSLNPGLRGEESRPTPGLYGMATVKPVLRTDAIFLFIFRQIKCFEKLHIKVKLSL
jgi:hypothetical protein